MNQENSILINKTIDFVKTHLKNAEAGHDWWHIQRVFTTAREISNIIACDIQVVELAALLHDISDSKFNGGDDEIGPQIISAFLEDNLVDASVVEKVIYIVQNMSFKKSFQFNGERPIEFQIVQDADRLDAIGAIGIARAFSYSGYKGHIFYDPSIPVQGYIDGKQYQKSAAPTINHFYEKLLLLKELMNTEEGKKRAEVRHQYMLAFLEQFYSEWDGKL